MYIMRQPSCPVKRKEEGKDQESIHSRITPYTRDNIWESDKTQGNITLKRAKKLPRQGLSTVKPCLKRPLKQKDQPSALRRPMQGKRIADYSLLLQREHSAILSTFIKLPLVTKIFVLSILSGQLRLYPFYKEISSKSFRGLTSALASLCHRYWESN